LFAVSQLQVSFNTSFKATCPPPFLDGEASFEQVSVTQQSVDVFCGGVPLCPGSALVPAAGRSGAGGQPGREPLTRRAPSQLSGGRAVLSFPSCSLAAPLKQGLETTPRLVRCL